MRRSAGMNRSFAGGQISRQAMNRRALDFGTTSDSPVSLRRGDGGVRQSGSVRADHAVDREHNRPRRGAGFDNPERDYGPPDQNQCRPVRASVGKIISALARTESTGQ